MEYLEEYGITKETIKILLEHYNDTVIFNLIVNKKNVEEIIKHLQKKKVNDLNQFFINNFELFFKPAELVKGKLPTEEWIHALENEELSFIQLFG